MTERSYSFTWQDPMIGANHARTVSGRDYLEAMVRGDVPPPPIALALNFGIAEVSNGHVIFTGTPSEAYYNPIGSVHGGWMCALLDSALGCCIQTQLPAGVGYTTLDLHINFVRPISATTGLMHCEATVIHSGRTMATSQAKLTDAAGKLYAHGSTTCMIFRDNAAR
jgi:uncharacterized protein (TIGR00369 family)